MVKERVRERVKERVMIKPEYQIRVTVKERVS